ncbi:AraC-like DNA-binding protein [Microbacteriaceae bacterium SG_E_30_P1]|uniref:AraC-like DNA-binding protein n=1 Tax=Antiquaquibacter oligotrophicus TaxID=2880260 RepID=A0ABT6KMH9_9MICO|nr:helix-turn-helix domain-containing protein [Antiquaquibacter oligotrophicus]MDH6180332.1 AraC-like DNA-binding protein [Antiquaquibacter oligotrophicus]UDF13922.1 helix-turn-helix domain-containing protein [Antiquaquibacter oligotrophicus]
MLVLDTQTLPAHDRGDAYQGAVSANCTTSAARFESPGRLWAKIEAFDLGPAKVLTIDASGTTLRRTPRMARGMNDCPIALALPVRSRNRLQWEREDEAYDRRDMMLVDLSAPYVYGWEGDGASYAFHVEFDELDLPMETIRSAMVRLPSSPLYGLVRDHIEHVMTGAGEIVRSGVGADVGAASVELMRALIVSAAGDTRHAAETMHSSVGARIDAYIRHHLRDPDLVPARIAAANAVSVRELYREFERRGASLEQSIMNQRLQGASEELRVCDPRTSVAEIGRAWGFRNASHFASRFKARFGLTPREWRSQPPPRA